MQMLVVVIPVKVVVEVVVVPVLSLLYMSYLWKNIHGPRRTWLLLLLLSPFSSFPCCQSGGGVGWSGNLLVSGGSQSGGCHASGHVWHGKEGLRLDLEEISKLRFKQGADIWKVCGYPLPPSCTGVVHGVLVRVSYIRKWWHMKQVNYSTLLQSTTVD